MGAVMKTYVLDACALIAYLRDEPGGAVLESMLVAKDQRFLLHAVTLGEVYYDSLRTSGQQSADELFDDVAQLPVQVAWRLTPALLAQAGQYKTSERISFADSFVLALATLEKATVISTDHHEFDALDDKALLPFFWLR
jgi:predicted nucleic acid-binding protein